MCIQPQRDRQTDIDMRYVKLKWRLSVFWHVLVDQVLQSLVLFTQSLHLLIEGGKLGCRLLLWKQDNDQWKRSVAYTHTCTTEYDTFGTTQTRLFRTLIKLHIQLEHNLGVMVSLHLTCNAKNCLITSTLRARMSLWIEYLYTYTQQQYISSHV